ncbi:hypothetical protein ONE63_003303 [Megalurothrips usitatus]|uniref:Methyltransferase domain-containing protein n=1 Tax=Megalurothrips usitatus TaxID=439358 RepID=A0AAV7XAE8_9NEOP|nr:hypothetical protein ONE63_003303 [Megalurothrips usitatus]
MNISREKRVALDRLKLTQQYSWLLDAFILDFYTENHWESLPATWRHVLSQVSLEELGEWMAMKEGSTSRVWPLSLLALRSASKALSLSREQQCSSEETKENENIASSLKEQRAGAKTDCLLHKNLKNLFVKHVKPKKRHETMVMAKQCAETALRSGISCVVDVGGGKGHLSRLLAYGYGLRVCCVEAQGDLVSSAKEIDKQIEYSALKYLDDSYVQNLPRPEYVVMTVANTGDALDQFRKEVFDKIRNSPEENVSFGIVGLHPCGDLAATMLHLFSNLNEAKFICIASCCYMKLTINKCDKVKGYPLSQFYQSLPKSLTNLSYEALEVSCHAIEVYCQKLQLQQYNTLKIHCYRAALEKLIVKYRPDLKHSGLRSVKHFDKMDFPSYAINALDRIGVVIPLSDLNSSETVERLHRWKDVVIFYSLRLLLAPLVESAVIIDRLFFVHEKGALGNVIPGFDPVVSPRNLMLQGIKLY